MSWNEKKPGCIHCGREFDKQDTVIIWRQRWRVHAICADFYDNGNHQLKGCIPCYKRWRNPHGS